MSAEAALVKTVVQKLHENAEIQPRELQDAVAAMLCTRLPEATVAAFLTALQMRMPKPEPPVLRAAAEGMLSQALKITLKADEKRPLVDIVGTGGDGKDAFNVSTAAGIIMAACGARVAKHGNRSSSGAVGSADFLEALGAKIDLGPEGTANVLSGCGFAFLFAQSFHPSMRRVAAARKAIGIRSIFNLLGPLTNPAQPARQVIGVSDRSLGPIFAALLRARGARHALVVHSLDGLDEISPVAPTYCWEVRAGLEIEERLLDPKADFDLDPIASLDDVCGGTASARAAAFRRALQGEAGPLRTFIVINAAAGLYVSGLADSLKAAAVMACEALDQGTASATLVGYIALSKSAAQMQSAEEGGCVPASPSSTQSAPHDTDADYASGINGNGVNGTNSDGGRGFNVRRSSQLQSYGSVDVHNGDGEGRNFRQAPRDSIAYVVDMEKPERMSYTTAGGIRVTRTKVTVPDAALEIEELSEWLNTNLGAIMLSDYEQPGRYKKWARGFADPPLMIVGQKRDFTISALNDRGRVLLPAITIALHMDTSIQNVEQADDEINGAVALPEGSFSEEERSKQPSLFSVVRVVSNVFKSAEDSELGLQGAFGYDLTFQFENTKLRMDRPDHQRDIVLFVPDQIFVWDQTGPSGFRYDYEFSYGGASTEGLPREGISAPFVTCDEVDIKQDHAPGLYAEKVRQARKKFKCGDLFECVLSQSFYEPCPEVPSKLFARLRERNPAPFAFITNLGDKEHLVGASPEMYVRVNGRRVETCPISGTIRRGTDPVDDAKQVFKLLANAKEEAELTMCTDVDRNDKSRICEPGSVKVLARRQIEMYSKLIHTVDHVEGIMREGFDALDAFLVHTWAVTVTGAPKSWAIQFLEDMEETPRAWYAGAVGTVHFNGDLNTGLTLRTIQIREGVACVRAGATLLWDSDPEAEEQETRLKASAFLEALRTPSEVVPRLPAPPALSVGAGFKVLVIDHQDSFVHTLANYLRQTGAEVRTLRAGFDPSVLDEEKPNMALLSPGPGTPEDFQVSAMIGHLVNRHIPIFGVCLGLQGMVEHFGGTLDVLDEPLHGKPTPITVTDPGSYLFKNMAPTFTAARYHSLYAVRDTLPSMLRVTAMSSDGVIMAVEHTRMPMAAVQFHPESILTAHHDGLSILENCIQHFRTENAAWKPKASAV